MKSKATKLCWPFSNLALPTKGPRITRILGLQKKWNLIQTYPNIENSPTYLLSKNCVSGNHVCWKLCKWRTLCVIHISTVHKPQPVYFLPHFWRPFLCFQGGFFQKILVIIQEQVMMACVRYMVIKISFFFCKLEKKKWFRLYLKDQSRPNKHTLEKYTGLNRVDP